MNPRGRASPKRGTNSSLQGLIQLCLQTRKEHSREPDLGSLRLLFHGNRLLMLAVSVSYQREIEYDPSMPPGIHACGMRWKVYDRQDL